MFVKGQPVELQPACDEWMQGDRFGEVVGYGRKRQYCTGGPPGRHTEANPTCANCTFIRPVRVKLNRSGRIRRFHPDNLTKLAPRIVQEFPVQEWIDWALDPHHRRTT